MRAFADWIRNMFFADFRHENVRCFQADDFLDARFSVFHVDFAGEHREHLRAVVHVPIVGLVGPMQADGRAVDLRQVAGAPRTLRPER